MCLDLERKKKNLFLKTYARRCKSKSNILKGHGEKTHSSNTCTAYRLYLLQRLAQMASSWPLLCRSPWVIDARWAYAADNTTAEG
ncbi:hypothetical protein SETIT_8G078000v2 [Setaria italica]|uniref:Uncharacterized protein n=1 Tax=Setaria italica TaxID=4555 RepID=A0A368S5A4_SETIT|nr:hypothetical protein SETIT_8G078000v2 [Setaria italica]